MKTIKDYKELLRINDSNTMLGNHLCSLFNEKGFFASLKDIDTMDEYNASLHNFDEKVEVMAQMHKNGINVFEDRYKMGSVSKAFYQYKLSGYTEYK
jgi:hypothetical protein